MTARSRLPRQAGEIITRFAPSPTGGLHLGHAYSAIRAHDFARNRGGHFLLRIEDIDSTRCREAFSAGIEEDLRWLGLDWDETPVRQSHRLPLYAEALDRLKAMNLIYPCFCTRADIAREVAESGAAPHGPAAHLYPGTCRNLAENERQKRLDVMAHAWRLDVAAAMRIAGLLHWHDETAGQVEAVPEALGDVVLARKETPTSYHLAVVVDDASQGVTDVVRGMDLFEATHMHRLLQAVLDLPTPDYHHHPLITDPNGKRLAKRNKAATLASLREAGADPALIVGGLRQGKMPVGMPWETA